MSERTERVGQLLTELVAMYIQHEANTDPLITITRVDVSPDLRKAIVFFTTLPDGREEDVFVFLKRHGTELRNHLKEKARMKRIPHLDFMLDAGERHRQHIDQLMWEIEEKKKSTKN